MKNAIPFENGITERLAGEPDFRRAYADEAFAAFRDGEVSVGLSMLRDIVKARMGFHELANRTGLHEKSLVRALSTRGNPTVRTLGKIGLALAEA